MRPSVPVQELPRRVWPRTGRARAAVPVLLVRRQRHEHLGHICRECTTFCSVATSTTLRGKLVQDSWLTCRTFQHGATLCVTTPSSLYSSLADSILALDCTLVDLTPTIGAILFEHDEAQPREGETVREAWERAGFHIKQVNTGGEKVEKAVREKWRERGVRVCIDYGPTCVAPSSNSHR